ncbi:non-specific lipid-transfer protein-like [Diospyros lotus]|uniref:non-specific lipid-transfer protein-like n=1 Tax=Diospyros lotus TaxID=55363 RepID=UPI00225B3627|nr:non-specific lipid-transfer protein-like [Diospyros lotus]
MLVSVVVLAVIATGPAPASGVVQCLQSVVKMDLCLSFLVGNTETPSEECCSATQDLDKVAAGSSKDKKALCECLYQSFHPLPLNYEYAKKLPSLCNLSVNFPPFTPHDECNKTLIVG